MLHVEDVILPLGNLLLEAAPPKNPYVMRGVFGDADWTMRFLSSVSLATSAGKPLSTAQASTLLRLISTHRTVLGTRFGSDNIARLLDRPVYRVEPYQTRNFPREVRHLGGNLLGLRFKLDPRIMEFLRIRVTGAMTMSVVKPRFDHGSRLWIVPVTRQSLPLIMDMIAEFDFAVDDATLEWLTMAHNAPTTGTVFFCDDQVPDRIVANVCDNEFISFFVTTVLGGEPA